MAVCAGAWGDDSGAEAAGGGFEAEAFDPFLSMGAPPAPAATPRLPAQGSRDSADDSFSLFIRFVFFLSFSPRLAVERVGYSFTQSAFSSHIRWCYVQE